MDYVTLAQAAEELGISVRALRFRIDRGELEAVKMNPRLYLIAQAEVDRHKQIGRLKPGPKPGSRRRRADEESSNTDTER